MSFSVIQSELQKMVVSWNLLPVQFEGIKFNNTKTSYMRMTVIPNPVVVGSLGFCNLHTGFMQIDLFYPDNKGVTEILSMADQVNLLVKNGDVLPDANLKFGNISIERRINDSGWIQQPITCEYMCWQ